MKNKTGRLFIALGCLLLAGALCLTAYNLLTEQRADRAAQKTAAALREIIPERSEPAAQTTASDGGAEAAPEAGTSSSSSASSTAEQTQTVTLDGQEYIGLLSLPALGEELPVHSTWSYALMQDAPCCYHGSLLTDDLVIAGHNYKKQFGALRLLSVGDKVVFTDVDGFVYDYQIDALETLGADDVDAMISGDWDLTLFTCTPGGVNRVAVRCRLTSGAS